MQCDDIITLVPSGRHEESLRHYVRTVMRYCLVNRSQHPTHLEYDERSVTAILDAAHTNTTTDAVKVVAVCGVATMYRLMMTLGQPRELAWVLFVRDRDDEFVQDLAAESLPRMMPRCCRSNPRHNVLHTDARKMQKQCILVIQPHRQIHDDASYVVSDVRARVGCTHQVVTWNGHLSDPQRDAERILDWHAS